jgi:hypothetical protein
MLTSHGGAARDMRSVVAVAGSDDAGGSAAGSGDAARVGVGVDATGDAISPRHLPIRAEPTPPAGIGSEDSTTGRTGGRVERGGGGGGTGGVVVLDGFVGRRFAGNSVGGILLGGGGNGGGLDALC